jgi:dTDP-4-dehydrorhamnose reductase
MKILLLGADGQVGWELRRSLAALGAVTACSRAQADLQDADGLAWVLTSVHADLVVNAAAYTAVDKAEAEPAAARRVNAEAVAQIAAHCHRAGSVLVHYSTDYVFDGTLGRPYNEADATHPLSVYGATKLAGEDASGCRHLIFRTSWVFGERGGNFLKTMLRLAAQRSELRVVADQVGVPTGAAQLADVTAQVMRELAEIDEHWGTYHLAAAGETSWHGYASHVITRARARSMPLQATSVVPIPASDYPTPAARPANSRLDCSKLMQTFGITLPDWRSGVDAVVDQVVDAAAAERADTLVPAPTGATHQAK